MMCFWHTAYMHGDGFANPNYVDALLDITAGLITEAQATDISLDHHYLRSKLDLEGTETYQDGIARIKKKFRSNPSVAYAEWLTRPLESMSGDIHQYDRSALPRIFDSHMEIALPVAVLGAKMPLDGDIVSRDLQPLLPPSENFAVGDMMFNVHGFSLTLVVDEGHHCYAFSAESVLSLATAIECNSFAQITDGDEQTDTAAHFFERKTLHVSRVKDDVVVHEHSGYRLCLKASEFRVLRGSNWGWLIKRHRTLRGDI
jgi:hypothetical protein